MPLRAPGLVPLRHAQRTESDSLIELDVAADHRSLADHDAASVIDEKAFSDARAGMDVDSGFGVGPLTDDARDHGDSSLIEVVGHAVSRDGLDRRIAEHDLLDAARCRITLVGSFHIL